MTAGTKEVIERTKAVRHLMFPADPRLPDPGKMADYIVKQLSRPDEEREEDPATFLVARLKEIIQPYERRSTRQED